MAVCSKCGYENRARAKLCGQCGNPLMDAGVGYHGGRAPGPAGPAGGGGGGAMLPTIPEAGDEWIGPGVRAADARVGGAASSVEEGAHGPPAGLPSTVHESGGAPASRAMGPRTQLHDEGAQPIVGWLVVLRSRSLRPYQDIPLFKGRNFLGRDPSRGPHFIEDANASTEHALVVGDDDGVTLTDLGSANGTVVNHEQIKACRLEKGDRVKIGKTTMVFIPFPKEPLVPVHEAKA